ncbi:hypothetical protein SKAU_G00021750 [Synaphobranchus kaupii]|uniref:Uncharacterized protein n=1 Tax=Synaphobranchus kaupii TaxID=118154 RepID=A0A9Q1GCG4_SYNKA|nr:hypothetical protein SKAU_G00021750 [Synaphobranchus kaupii]
MGELKALTEEVRQLQQDRETHRRELTAVTEELRDRDRTVQNLTEQLHSLSTHNHQPSVSPTENTQDPPAQPESSTTPSITDNPLILPTPSETHTQSASPAPNPEGAEIVLLIDSNGKCIDEKQLFPRHRVSKIWCPNTKKALELLTASRLGSRSHILIHTGTNDLRGQQERVAMSIRGVIEKATHTFPESRIIISTLLPRKDFHPQTIQKVNAVISRECALRPNVHHPTLCPHSLFDHVHLYREAVHVFAQSLKNTALGQNPVTPYRSNRPPQPTQPPKTAILIDSNGKFLHHRKLFPRHKVAKFWCPTTDRALQLLCQSSLDNPDNIVIHTGTNDLRSKREGVSEAVREMAEKAHRVFPEANIVISTLLPRTDFPQHMINKINKKITKDCAPMTNINIAHHPAITHEHLYDGLHLDQDSVRIFAKSIKDTALGRSPLTHHHSQGPLDTWHPITETSAQPRMTQPNRAYARMTQPSGAQPSAARPRTTQPSAVRPSPAQPDPGRPSPAQSDPGRPSPAEPSPAQSDPAQRRPTQDDPAQWNPTQDDPAQRSPAQRSPLQ